MGRHNIRYDAVISGAGIAGLTLALLLGQAGLEVALIEPNPPPSLKNTKPSGRTVALMQSSLNAIKATGVWPAVAMHGAPMRTMRIMDASVKNTRMMSESFEAAEIGLQEFGYNIPNTILRSALFDHARQAENIALLSGQRLLSFTAKEASIAIRLENGKSLGASLLIGADGRQSRVRSLSKIDASSHAYGQSALTLIIDHQKPHYYSSTEFHRPGGPLAFVPLPGRQSSVVWVEKTKRAAFLSGLDGTELEDILHQNMHGLLGDARIATPVECWPLIAMRAARLTETRVALAAEAAHVMSPITAQGLNLSLRDVVVLAETLIDAARAGLDIGRKNILDRYEARRAADIATRTALVDGMNRLVAQDNEKIQKARRLAIKTIALVPPLKKFSMSHALAPGIDMGRIRAGIKL